MKIVIKGMEVEIELTLADLSALPRLMRQQALNAIGDEAATEIKNPETHEIMKQRQVAQAAQQKSEKIKKSWTPEMRQAASERMRKMQAAKKGIKS